MKKITLLFVFLSFSFVMSSAVYAAGLSFSGFDDDYQTVDTAEFAKRLRIKGEIFITDASGLKFISRLDDIVTSRLPKKGEHIDSNWLITADGIKDITITHKWTVKDGTLTVHIKQYDTFKYSNTNQEDFSNKSKIINEQTIVVENFAPVTYVAEQSKKIRTIVRFTPYLSGAVNTEDIGKLTLGSSSTLFTISDNQGYLWGANARFGGVYSGVRSHRGSFTISYYPFKGAKLLGMARGRNIILNLTDTLDVTINSDETLVPEDQPVKVYGIYKPNFKSVSPSKLRSFGKSKIERVSPEFL